MRCLVSPIKKSVNKPLPSCYPSNLETIGDHIRTKRLDLKMYQKELALQLNVCQVTIKNWEKGYKDPVYEHLPRIYNFLGYCPIIDRQVEHFGHRLRNYRKHFLGMSLFNLAKEIGIDPSTLSKVEESNIIRFKRVLKAIQLFVKEESWQSSSNPKMEPTRLPRRFW